MEASGPQRYQERSGKEAPWVWASPLLRCASSREALPLFVSVQWLAQVALKGLEFALPLRSLRPLGSQWIPGFLLTPNRRPSPSRPKISTSGALSFTGRKDRRWGSKSRSLRTAKQEACSENTGEQHVSKGIFYMVSTVKVGPPQATWEPWLCPRSGTQR